MSRKFAKTEKQAEILDIILKRVDNGLECTINDIAESLSYSCSKQALLFSLRILEEHGMIVKERGINNWVPMRLKPTMKAYETIRIAPIGFEEE